uniref:Transport and Golgi organization protein 2 n=2 Tax=Photinus pyralis TaxID=7054 RepID=A0A1Y1MC64_PHOPY
MCILFLYTDPSPPSDGYRLIVATNRDEYFDRPTASAYHSIEENIIGGRDLQPGKEGGMWFGVSLNKTLRLGSLLNVTGADCNGKGRGYITSNYLKGDLPAEAYIDSLPDEYSAYNFVTAELRLVWVGFAARTVIRFQAKPIRQSTTPATARARVRSSSAGRCWDLVTRLSTCRCRRSLTDEECSRR